MLLYFPNGNLLYLLFTPLYLQQISYGYIFDVLVDGPISSMNILNKNSPNNFYVLITLKTTITSIRKQSALLNRLQSKITSDQSINLTALQCRQACQYANSHVRKASLYQFKFLRILHWTREKWNWRHELLTLPKLWQRIHRKLSRVINPRWGKNDTSSTR
jgi:hypothetical protein